MLEKYLDSEFLRAAIEKTGNWLIEVAPSILLLFGLYWIVKKVATKTTTMAIMRATARYEESEDLEGKKRVVTITTLIQTVLSIVIKVIFTVLVLSQIGIDIAPLIAGAGIVGLAVGFGSQELVRDFISGFFLILEDQIRVGDVVNINGFGGVVEKIEIRTITLRDYSGTVHIIQNGKINSVSNLTKDWSAVSLDIGVAYKEDPDQVIEIMTTVAEGMKSDAEFGDRMVDTIEIGGLDRFGESEMIIKARIKTIPAAQWSVGREFRKRLKAAFDEKGIEIPFPHRTLVLKSDGKEPDPKKEVEKILT